MVSPLTQGLYYLSWLTFYYVMHNKTKINICIFWESYVTHSEQNSQEMKPNANVIISPKVVCKSNAWNHREEPNSEWSALEESCRRTSALTELLLVKQNIHTEQLHRSARETSPNSSYTGLMNVCIIPCA